MFFTGMYYKKREDDTKSIYFQMLTPKVSNWIDETGLFYIARAKETPSICVYCCALFEAEHSVSWLEEMLLRKAKALSTLYEKSRQVPEELTCWSIQLNDVLLCKRSLTAVCDG